jgi:ribosomal protein S18 acetylase RimI-like enzyme
MSKLIDKIIFQIKQYKDCDDLEKTKILKLLNISFDINNDPYLLDTTIIVIFYYKDYVIGVICGMNNSDLIKNDLFLENRVSYNIDYDKVGIFIYNLAVLKSCRNNGLGKYLVKILISHFRNIGVEYFHVHIDEDNKYSLNIFEKLGFKIKKTLMNSENKPFNLLTLFVK